MQTPVNRNYAATVTRIKAIIPLENCDNVVSVPIFGMSAIVSKDTQVGDIGIVFPAETQLSDEFVSNNNLYRHADLNKDPDQKEYFEDNRRVKAVKFRGNVSNCFFIPLSSLEWTGFDVSSLKEGDEFDVLNGKEICKKYVVVSNEPRLSQGMKKRKFSRVDSIHFPEHFSTIHFLRYRDTIPAGTEVVVTQKLHGTSIRIGHTIVKRKLSLLDKISKLWSKVQETEYDYVYGSRKVIKDAENKEQVHYYETDLWSEEGKKLKGLLPKEYIVYAEIIGWIGEKPIQQGYTYSLPNGQSKLFVYRIAQVNEDGYVTDLSWDQVKEFCKFNGLNHVPELWKGRVDELDVEKFMNVRYADTYPHAVYSENVDEGVCVRAEGIIPKIYKAKCSQFLEHETNILNQQLVDIEESNG